MAFKPYCRSCGHFGQGARTFTGAVQCAKARTFVTESTIACPLYVKVGTLEGNLARLGEAMTWARTAVGLLSGSNVGTVTDPRHPSPEPQRRRRRV